MLVHVVLFSFKPELDGTAREAVLRAAREELPRLPGVRHLLVGKCVNPEPEYDYALSMYFEDEKALDAYRDHPDHVRFRDERFKPHLSAIKGLDYAE